MSSSSLHWEELRNLPGSLSFALSFVFILPEILLSAQEWDSLGKESIFCCQMHRLFMVGAGRNMYLVNLLENNHHLPPLITVQ